MFCKYIILSRGRGGGGVGGAIRFRGVRVMRAAAAASAAFCSLAHTSVTRQDGYRSVARPGYCPRAPGMSPTPPPRPRERFACARALVARSRPSPPLVPPPPTSHRIPDRSFDCVSPGRRRRDNATPDPPVQRGTRAAHPDHAGGIRPQSRDNRATPVATAVAAAEVGSRARTSCTRCHCARQLRPPLFYILVFDDIIFLYIILHSYMHVVYIRRRRKLIFTF